MKHIKLNFFLLLLFTIILSCTDQKKTEYSTDADIAFLVITDQTTKEELATITEEFKVRRNIDLDFSKTEFSATGQIQVLDFHVNCNDGFTGTATSTGSILENKNSGFSRNYKKDATEPFIMGAM